MLAGFHRTAFENGAWYVFGVQDIDSVNCPGLPAPPCNRQRLSHQPPNSLAYRSALREIHIHNSGDIDKSQAPANRLYVNAALSTKARSSDNSNSA